MTVNVVLTGVTGFLGTHIYDSLSKKYHFKFLVRGPSSSPNYFDINNDDDVRKVFELSDVVIHCAGRAHILNENSNDPWEQYYESNVKLTKRLAEFAVSCCVKRFIFISTLKVNGEKSILPFKQCDPIYPQDHYSLSKALAEYELKLTLSTSNVDYTIIRPPLIYGSGVKANFRSMMNFSKKNIPLPFGSFVNNLRSFIYVGNLVDLIDRCVWHDSARRQVFLASDGDDLSTKNLFSLMSLAHGKNAFFLPIPILLFRLFFSVVGKPLIFSRLSESLQADISHTKVLLEWNPPFTVQQGFKNSI